MRLMSLRESLGLGVYVSAFAALFVVPFGVVSRSWALPTLAFLAIMAVCLFWGWIAPRNAVLVVCAWTVAWCAGVALAAGLIGFGVNAIVSFEPHCVSSVLFKCFSTVEEQRASNDRAALLPIGGGAFLLVLFVVLGIRGVLNTYRAHRARRF